MDDPEGFRVLVRRIRELQEEMDQLIPLLDESGLPFVSTVPIEEDTWKAWDRAYDEQDEVHKRLRELMRKHFGA
jgi:hypothetical protein